MRKVDFCLSTRRSLRLNLTIRARRREVGGIVDRHFCIRYRRAAQHPSQARPGAHAESSIQNALKRQYRDAQVAVTISRLRTIRIYVVGDVQRPGSYEISSLASPLNALYAAGGPTAVGSLRILQHFRGKQLIGDVDLYDFLLHGTSGNDDRLEGGDTLVVPASGPQVAVWGAIKRPAIYELKGDTNLADLLANAGGVTAAASLDHIAIERIGDNRHRETISFSLSPGSDHDADLKAMAAFPVKDGDRIHAVQLRPGTLHRNFWYWSELPAIARQFNADLVHISYPSLVNRNAFSCPTVVSLHDLYPFDIPSNFGFPKVLFNRAILRQCLRAVNAIAWMQRLRPCRDSNGSVGWLDCP